VEIEAAIEIAQPSPSGMTPSPEARRKPRIATLIGAPTAGASSTLRAFTQEPPREPPT
jgi:hypothetical protein